MRRICRGVLVGVSVSLWGSLCGGGDIFVGMPLPVGWGCKESIREEQTRRGWG